MTQQEMSEEERQRLLMQAMLLQARTAREVAARAQRSGKVRKALGLTPRQARARRRDAENVRRGIALALAGLQGTNEFLADNIIPVAGPLGLGANLVPGVSDPVLQAQRTAFGAVDLAGRSIGAAGARASNIIDDAGKALARELVNFIRKGGR